MNLRPRYTQPDPHRFRMVIDYDLCTGCRRCEAFCSLSHPPFRLDHTCSRIRVIESNHRFYPVVAGPVPGAASQCLSKKMMVLGDLVIDNCLLCRAVCPSRPYFRNPDTGRALKCDLCLTTDETTPYCVIGCPSGALSLEFMDNRQTGKKMSGGRI